MGPHRVRTCHMEGAHATHLAPSKIEYVPLPAPSPCLIPNPRATSERVLAPRDAHGRTCSASMGGGRE